MAIEIRKRTAAELIREIAMWMQDSDEGERRKFLLLMKATLPKEAPRCPICRSYKLQCPNGHAWETPNAK